MDKLHISLIVLLGIAIIFLGMGFIQDTTDIIKAEKEKTEKEPETWSINITPEHFASISDYGWLGRLKAEDSLYIQGNDLRCLNICGQRCIWMGYDYKNHTSYPDKYLWGDKDSVMCGCSCFVSVDVV